MGDVLKAMGTKVAEPDAGRQFMFDKRSSGVGDDYLSSVRRRSDPRGAVRVESDVVAAAEPSLPGVQPHPDPDGCLLRPGIGGEVPLRGNARAERAGGRGEGGEEGVALDTDNRPAAAFDGAPEDRGVLVLEQLVAIRPERLK